MLAARQQVGKLCKAFRLNIDTKLSSQFSELHVVEQQILTALDGCTAAPALWSRFVSRFRQPGFFHSRLQPATHFLRSRGSTGNLNYTHEKRGRCLHEDSAHELRVKRESNHELELEPDRKLEAARFF